MLACCAYFLKFCRTDNDGNNCPELWRGKNIFDLNLTEFEFKVCLEDVKRREGKNIFDVKLHARDLNYAFTVCFYRMAYGLTPRNASIPLNETLTIFNRLI